MEYGLKQMPDPSRIRQNPFYSDIMENGFSITIHYSPEDVADIVNGKQKYDFDLLEHDPDELAAFEKYRKSNQVKAI
jgi:hypothetical protein